MSLYNKTKHTGYESTHRVVTHTYAYTHTHTVCIDFVISIASSPFVYTL